MEAVSFPDEKLAGFINSHFVPLRVPSDSEPLATKFNVQWTPTFLVLDAEGRPHHQVLGFYAAEDFIPELMLGWGKFFFGSNKPAEAEAVFGDLLKGHPTSDAAPQALFLYGVTGFLKSHDAKRLKEMYERQQKEYPASPWAKRAYPYRLL